MGTNDTPKFMDIQTLDVCGAGVSSATDVGKQSFARVVHGPLLLGCAYILAVPLALRAMALSNYHGWWPGSWALKFFWLHIAVGAFVAILRLQERDLRAWARERAAIAVLAGVIIGSFMVALTAWKHAIWTFGWFTWDPALASLDRWIHFGRYPHEWLAPLIAAPGFMRSADWVYGIWGTVVIGTLAGTVWAGPADLSRRCLLTFFGTWILLGSLLAPLLGSVGPAYYARFLSVRGPYTSAFPVAHLPWGGLLQEQLWIATNARTFIPGAGISAMPSLHVAEATLVALLAWNGRHWFIRLAGLAFPIAIQVAAVVLGWHYAIDGYVAAAVTCLLWWATGPTQRSPRGPRSFLSAGERYAGAGRLS